MYLITPQHQHHDILADESVTPGRQWRDKFWAPSEPLLKMAPPLDII
jgi:hypothetical protein